MTNRRTLFSCCCAFLVFLVGCCATPKRDPLAQFRQKHPQEAKAYSYIHPVSTDMYDMIFRVKSVAITGIGHSLKQRFADTTGLVEYADKILTQENAAAEEWERLFAGLREASASGGFICEYQWSNGKTKETGLLVLKSGDVVKREPWLTSYLSGAQQ